MVSGPAEAALRVGAVSPKKEHDMNKLFTLALATAVCLGTTVLLANNRPAARHLHSADAQMAADGAFRDGLYVGRLAAEGGGPLRPQIGRWSNEHDRAAFVAGYRRGYQDSLASAAQGSQSGLE
jgi:hypothetical protein